MVSSQIETWGIVLAIILASRKDRFGDFLLVVVGASIGWASGTIARYVVPTATSLAPAPLKT